jgi:hypothetical protein
VVELLDRANESQVAFLDSIKQREPVLRSALLVTARDQE